MNTNTTSNYKPATQEFKDVINSICKLESAFHVEMNAKNQAYYFILENGQFDSFRAFCQNNKTEDPPKNCIDFFIEKGKEMEPIKHKSINKKGFIKLDLDTRNKIVLSLLKNSVITQRLYESLLVSCNVLAPNENKENFEPGNVHDVLGDALTLLDIEDDGTMGDNNFYWYLIKLFSDTVEECSELNYKNAANEIFERWAFEIREWERNNRVFVNPNKNNDESKYKTA